MKKNLCTDKQLRFLISLRLQKGEVNYKHAVKQAGLKLDDMGLYDVKQASLLIDYLKFKPDEKVESKNGIISKIQKNFNNNEVKIPKDTNLITEMEKSLNRLLDKIHKDRR
jgi:hypothetical protein